MSQSDTGTVAGNTPNGSAVKRAWGEHLGRYPWDHFLTLTFRRESIPDFARRSWLSYTRRVEQLAGMPLTWFYGTEYGALGRLHLHALTLNTGQLSIAQLHREWFQPPPQSRGLTKIAVYSPLLGAAHYVAKYVTKDLADYDVSDRLEGATAARGRQFRPAPGSIVCVRRAEASRAAADDATFALAAADGRSKTGRHRTRSHRPQHSRQRQK